MQNTHNMDTGQLPAMSPSNCWSKCLAAHLLIFVIQPSSSVKFLGFKLRLCKKFKYQVCLAVPFSRAFLKLNFLIKFFLTLEAVRAADDHRAIRRSFMNVTLFLTRLPCGVSDIQPDINCGI